MGSGQKRQRKVVSKARYILYIVDKATLSFWGAVVAFIGLLGFVLLAFLLIGFVERIIQRHSLQFSDIYYLLLTLFLVGGGSFVLVYAGVHEAKDATAGMEPVAPLTRNNLELLPAEKSLVRDSSEPTAAQEAVLLRPAQAGQETPSEELLRPSIEANTSL